MKTLDYFRTLALALVIAAGSVCAGEGPAFKKDDHNLSAGLSYSWDYGMGLAVAWDKGAINDMFSFGAGFDYSAKSYEHYVGYIAFEPYAFRKYRERYITPSFRFAFHVFGIPALAERPNLAKHDVFAVLRLGPQIWFRSFDSDFPTGHYFYNHSKNGVNFMWDVASGYRFHFNEKAHLWAQVGYYGSVIGIGLKF